MTDNSSDFSKPRSFETKDLPGGYSPAPVPEFHQQHREPGYANSSGPEGDGGGTEWAASTSVDGVWEAGQDTEHEDAGNNSDKTAKSGDSGKGGTSTASGGTRTKSATGSSSK